MKCLSQSRRLTLTYLTVTVCVCVPLESWVGVLSTSVPVSPCVSYTWGRLHKGEQKWVGVHLGDASPACSLDSPGIFKRYSCLSLSHASQVRISAGGAGHANFVEASWVKLPVRSQWENGWFRPTSSIPHGRQPYIFEPSIFCLSWKTADLKTWRKELVVTCYLREGHSSFLWLSSPMNTNPRPQFLCNRPG